MISIATPQHSLLPQTIPGKTVPARPEAAEWVGTDLVSYKGTKTYTAGSTDFDITLGGRGIGKPTDGAGARDASGAYDLAAFTPLSANSLADAVEAASKLSAERIARTGRTASPDAFEKTAPALALLQGASGSYYVTALVNRHANEYPSDAAASIDEVTIDTNSINMVTRDVAALNPAVKAVVGAYSWVNFTNEQIAPQLAG